LNAKPAAVPARSISLAKPAMVKVMTAAAPISPDYIAQSLEEWLPNASATGITSVFDGGTILLPEEAGYLWQELHLRAHTVTLASRL
jgi:hypothetical protein